ncbi:MAG: hypothetical protein WCG23_01220 [bacterium]
MMNVAFNPIQQNKQQLSFSGKREVAENLAKALVYSASEARTYKIGNPCGNAKLFNGRVDAYIDAAISDKAFLSFLKNPAKFLNIELLSGSSDKGTLPEIAVKAKDGCEQFAEDLRKMVKGTVGFCQGDPLYGKTEAIGLLEKFFQKIESRTK